MKNVFNGKWNYIVNMSLQNSVVAMLVKSSSVTSKPPPHHLRYSSLREAHILEPSVHALYI